MKSNFIHSSLPRGFVALLILSIATSGSQADTSVTNEDFRVLGQQVLQLLESRDVDHFAEELAPAIKDWRSVLSTNLVAAVKGEDPLGPGFEKGLNRQRKAVADSARLVLEQATQLGLGPSQVRFRFKGAFAKGTGSHHNPRIQAEGETLPWANEIKIILLGEPAQDSQSGKRLQGEYEVALGGAFKFPGAWRCYEGIRWNHFPPAIADQRMQQNLALVSKVSAHTGPLGSSDDPALSDLAKVLVRFLQERDEKMFAKRAMLSFDELWGEFEKQFGDDKERPSRKDVEESLNRFNEQILGSARGVSAQIEHLGIDFAGVDIKVKDVMAENPHQSGVFGTVEGIDANPVRFTFSVQSDRKTKAERSISGEYMLTAARAHRGADRWSIQDKIRWERFPEGMLSEQEISTLEFENYVGEHGALPPGTDAPEVELVRLDDGGKIKVADFRGKVIVLEWWATWCGPCQQPMAELQTLREHHPEWKGKVEIVAASIDDELRQVREHIGKREWTNTFNTWAGPGGWESGPAKQFRIRGVPTCYVIDSEGKVVQGGHFISKELTNIVGTLLR